MLIGKVCFYDKTTDYLMENDDFCNTIEELEHFSLFLNSPWGQADETYKIKYNCVDNYTEKDPNIPDWICKYCVVGYDGITSILYGYGDTQQESLQNCISLFERLQKEFNKDDDAI